MLVVGLSAPSAERERFGFPAMLVVDRPALLPDLATDGRPALDAVGCPTLIPDRVADGRPAFVDDVFEALAVRATVPVLAEAEVVVAVLFSKLAMGSVHADSDGSW
ncbi:hypothetical protein [Natrinema versiforme]|uniref:hypothetical protein n=1 Tax=Natrinema versiforme TaxID=88724 RepID=UPI001EF9DB27|nr:hypothetical protein [Natrinema versiforme]